MDNLQRRFSLCYTDAVRGRTVRVTSGMKTFTKTAAAFLFVGLYLFCLQPAGPVSAQQPSGDGIEFFEKRIRPVLESNCYRCHSAASKSLQGGLLLDSRAGLLKGGNSGQPAIIPGDPDNSI